MAQSLPPKVTRSRQWFVDNANMLLMDSLDNIHELSRPHLAVIKQDQRKATLNSVLYDKQTCLPTIGVSHYFSAKRIVFSPHCQC